MFTFSSLAPSVPQVPSTTSTAVEPPLSTDLISLSSSPICPKEFTFTLLPPPPPSNPAPKLLDLFPNTNPSLRDDNNNDHTNSYNNKEKISDSTLTLAGHRVSERFTSPWIRKRLTASDVNTSSRLLLSKEEIVNKYVLPSISQERRNECHGFKGLKVKVYDVDTCSQYELVFKRWHSGSYVLTSNWRLHFANRRSLKNGDIIELLWDSKNLRFFFRKLGVQF